MIWLKTAGVYLASGAAVYLVIDLIRPGLSYTATVAGIAGLAYAIYWYRKQTRRRTTDKDEGAWM